MRKIDIIIKQEEKGNNINNNNEINEETTNLINDENNNNNNNNTMPTTNNEKQGLSSEVQLLISVSGIYFFYLYYGILQEQIWTTTEDDGSRFTFMLFLLLVQCITNAFVAFIGVTLFDKKKTNANDKNKSLPMSSTAKSAPNYLKMILPNVSGNIWMAVISFTYLSAMGASNQSLNYVNYPTQALGKSCKMIPIMLLNVLIGGKKYSLREYLCVLSITLGIVFFRLAKSKGGSGQENSSFGLILLFASLSLDGLTASNQRLFRTEFKPSTYGMMLQTNLWALLYLLIANIITGQGQSGFQYCMEYTHIWIAILKFSLCSAFGQVFIFFTITGPGPLVCTTITTTRKFFTILLSVMLNPNNHLNNNQWIAVGLVFLGLGGEIAGKYQAKNDKKKLKLNSPSSSPSPRMIKPLKSP